MRFIRNDIQLDNAEKEAISIANEMFEAGWDKLKIELECESKKESCRQAFILGFLQYMQMMDSVSGEIKEQIDKNPKEFKELLKKEGLLRD